MVQCDAPSRPSPVLHPFVHKSGGFSSVQQHSLSSSRMAVIPEFSDTQNRQHHEHDHAAVSDSAESSTLSEEEGSNPRSAESGHTAPRSLRRTKSSRDVHTNEGSSRQATLPSNDDEGDLQGFADRFRALVDRVSRELEESRISESHTEPTAPPLHHVLDTHTPYMSIDEFGREVPCQEPIAVLGAVIKRMPTIESVGSRELASLRSTTVVSGTAGIGSHSAATSTTSSRPPTRGTMASFNDAPSASLESASQPSSRSNSIHRLRTPSELGELVRDAIRTRGQSRPLQAPYVVGSTSARPSSGGSMSGSGCGSESASAPARSRSNSLGPNEMMLAPVTEHGELGREDARPPQRPAVRHAGNSSSRAAASARARWASWCAGSGRSLGRAAARRRLPPPRTSPLARRALRAVVVAVAAILALVPVAD
jgi:hypothetical protein